MRLTRHASLLLSLVLCLGLVGCDHATKYLAETTLRGHPPKPVITWPVHLVDLTYTQNRDIAFSLLRHVPQGVKTPLIFIGGALGLLAICLVYYQHRKGRTVEHLALSLILAGALGNLTDRLFRGYVVDFVHLHHWPVFNVADVCLVVGGGLLLLLSLRPPKEASQTS